MVVTSDTNSRNGYYRYLSLNHCYGYFLSDGTTIGSHKGSFNPSGFYGDNNLMFPEPLKLEPEVIYITQVDFVAFFYPLS